MKCCSRETNCEENKDFKFRKSSTSSFSLHHTKIIESKNLEFGNSNINFHLSSDSRMPGDDRGSPSSLSEFDSAIGTNTASPGSDRKEVNSGCSSMSDREEANFECYGEGDVECDSDSTSVKICDEVDGTMLLSPPHSLPPSNFGRRNSWVRRSLRCSPSSTQEKVMSPKRWGSFRNAPNRVGGTAVASQLYRTSSFSSGRSSAPDQDDMYSDASLEDDVLDLNHKAPPRDFLLMEEEKDKPAEEKDPMRDSLMSNSDNEDDYISDLCLGEEGNLYGEDGASSLDLELDLWEGQFDFSATNTYYDSVFSSSKNGFNYCKEMIKTVQVLQQQVGVLADNQINTDDRYTRAKQDNSALQARVMMLEEQLRDTEMRGEERLSEEQRRNKELITRVEREKLLTVENYSIKHACLEKERTALVEDNLRLKKEIERISKERSHLEHSLSDSEIASSQLRQENSKICEVSKREKEELRIERERSSQVIEELRCEVERLRAVEEAYTKRAPPIDSPSSPNPELEAELKLLRNENKRLSDQVEELQAQLMTSRLEEGRTLIAAASNNSLAAEFEQMDSDEEAQNSSISESVQLMNRLKECQEDNKQLRSYIDEMLLNIVENYPQLLEVKNLKKK